MPELKPDDINQIRRLIALARDILQRYAELAEAVNHIIKQQQANDAISREFYEEVSRQLEDIERLFLLERTGNEDSREGKRIRGKFQKREDDKQLRELLKEQTKNYLAIKLKISKYGGETEAPLRLIKQLEELEASIEHIKTELGELD